MTIRIETKQLEHLHEYAREGYPHEVCGILAGSRNERLVSEVVALVNEGGDSAEKRYKVSGLVMLRAELDLEARGLEVVGYYHSHPDHLAGYSDHDREHALPNMSYLITSVMEGTVVDTRSWRLTEDRSAMDAEDIQVT